MNREISLNIKHARKMAGLTQEELGKAIGNKSAMTIAQYERTLRTPTIDGLKRIADALNITIDNLLPQEWLSPAALHDMEMTLNDYQKAAARFINTKLYPEQQLDHALHGLAGEVGEIHSLFQKEYQGHPLDPVHLKKETGDALWMITEICTAMNWTLEEVAQTNIAKLKARYPNGFEVAKSLHRKEGDI